MKQEMKLQKNLPKKKWNRQDVIYYTAIYAATIFFFEHFLPVWYHNTIKFACYITKRSSY